MKAKSYCESELAAASTQSIGQIKRKIITSCLHFEVSNLLLNVSKQWIHNVKVFLYNYVLGSKFSIGLTIYC